MSRHKLRILLADPCSPHCVTLQGELQAAGYEVELAATGQEVLVQCEIDPPDVVILDVDMPDMNGFDVCELVRHDTLGADATVIMTTMAGDEMTQTYLGPMVDFAGGDYFVVKPCDTKIMLNLIDELAGSNERPDAPARSGFPTRAVWPTARAMTLSLCG